ncbi:lanthionine synthetase LanC family protein [Actinophytocola sp. NPDC049390]|uniref:lanthionine synthetase LanC family protein n=1 Tax=Actinophytocola sp. NPDC049390 TaxID=3363894 RepID=UPI0037A7E47A
MPYRDVADAAWRWVLTQVRWDGDEVSIPESPGMPVDPSYRDGMHSGVGGLAHALAEIRLSRPWTAEEERLASAIAAQVSAGVPHAVDYNYFDGLVSAIGVLTTLGADPAPAVSRLADLATPDGWPQTGFDPPAFLPGVRVNDLVLGTAGIVLAAVWTESRALATRAADLLLAEAEEVPTGLDWAFVPRRFRTDEMVWLPNFSHGVAGIATALAVAGIRFDRPDLVTAATRGAEHLLSLGDGYTVPQRIPVGEEPVAHGWCHGGSGTSLLYVALARAGVVSVAGEPPMTWHRRALEGVRTSGLPERLRPGFWDNDGRCCGTAGVGDVFLDSWCRGGEAADLEFAVRLADALVARAVVDGPHAYWRFVEHRNDDPLLPPGIGWMQGAAGIAAYLFRVGRALRGSTEPVPRMDNWWAVS